MKTLTTGSIYLAVIVVTCWVSGLVAGRATVYDRYIVRLDGPLLAGAPTQELSSFYRETLELSEVRHDDQVLAFRLPDKKLLYIDRQPSEQRHGFRQRLVLRVRNGFDKLHNEFVEKIEAPPEPLKFDDGYEDRLASLPPGSITQVAETSWGREFAIVDPAGNTLIFYTPKHLLGSRL
ncbi:MAG: hypothetical protein KDD44_14645 [Bdellovibrionales bacterium]|nr:hypothetical protein [Bdellovibrionales bacterium]